ncbi:hypothetical protein BDZ94DRAFT_1139402, partial [Collybia nuda]
YLKRFHNGWAVQEFIKLHLKNRHAYAWKRGYTTETGNPIGGSNDDDGAYKDHEMNIDIDEHERDKVDSGDEGGKEEEEEE